MNYHDGGSATPTIIIVAVVNYPRDGKAVLSVLMRWYLVLLVEVVTIVSYVSSLALTTTKHQHQFAFVHHFSHHVYHPPRRAICRTSAKEFGCYEHTSLSKSCHNIDIIEKDTSIDEEEDTSSLQFVAKTIESFKLADLYWLESCVMARYLDSGTVDRLAFHRPTASYLLGYSINNEDFNGKKIELPFRTSRSQYVAKVLASGSTPQELLDNIQLITVDDVQLQWVIEYDTFEPLQNEALQSKKKSFSSTMLMCTVSRLFPGEPCLNPYYNEDTTTKDYIIIETKHRLYLAQKLSDKDANLRKEDSSSSTKQIAKQFKDTWSKRPFQYSGAINLDVAFVLIDILSDILHIDDATTRDKPIRLLDPTCGSGTFLSLALKAWGDQVDVEAVGIDSNIKCAEGTIRNLMHITNAAVQDEEEDNVWTLTVGTSKVIIHAKDSVQLPTFISDKFDCAVANLPWNRNTFEYNEGKNTIACTNSGILEATAATLKTGSPVIVVSGRDNEQDELGSSFNTRNCLENLGFRIVGEATIPPKGYALPSSSKKTGGMKKKGVQSRTSDCLITVAISPQR